MSSCPRVKIIVIRIEAGPESVTRKSKCNGSMIGSVVVVAATLKMPRFPTLVTGFPRSRAVGFPVLMSACAVFAVYF
jgi:hypothetical protein